MFKLNFKIPQAPPLKVLLRNREETLYEGPARSVSSVNVLGPFDVLPGHTNFVSLIKSQVIIRLRRLAEGGEERRAEIEGPAVLLVYRNQVKIFLGIAKPPPIPT